MNSGMKLSITKMMTQYDRCDPVNNFNVNNQEEKTGEENDIPC